MRFAEVLLPLPLYGTFTYSIPDDIAADVQIGSRVLVQFGKKKHYTGIVSLLHERQPAGYEVKPISALLDPAPIIKYPQLKLWEWIAEYYLCSPGEVYKAAVPTGLKPESETFVTADPEFMEDPEHPLTERQRIILEYLETNRRGKISEIEQATKLKNVAQQVNRMLCAGMISIDETVVERYRARKVVMVSLTCPRGDQEALHSFFDMTTRSRQQERTLVAYLDLSRWMNQKEELKDVTREELQAKAGVTPGVVKALETKGIFRLHKERVNRFNNCAKKPDLNLATLSESQNRALSEITDAFRERDTVLLHGVTGSGKTEIYTHLAREVLNRGNQVLYLVPEISLTTQLTDRLRKTFGDRLVVYHSKFSDNERVDIWRRLLQGNEPLVILGVRSSVFLPFSRIGLVIVDEEHESSYKQYDPAPRYNARDAAIMLASMHGAKTLLGSATPSVETYWKSEQGKFGLVKLDERFRGAELPEVTVVDMKEARKRKEASGILSATLAKATEHTLQNGGQAIMFQNRRGFSPIVICHTCGWTPKCEHCDVSLVYHKSSGMLRCHYCGYARTVPKTCPACGEIDIRHYGYGTERIAEELHRRFEGYRVARMDLDTTRNKDSCQEIIDEFSRHDTDILVGTQMVTKGLDFGNVRTVGVLNADTLLNFPDFRSNERAFNMLEQVAGRAGRRQGKGEVIIQTTQTSNPILEHVRRHDYPAYYKEELEERRRYGYPPFTKIINIYLKNRDVRSVDTAALCYARALTATFGQRVLGPEKPFVSRVANFHLQGIMLKVESTASMKKVKAILRQIYESLAGEASIRSSILYFDVDPV